IARKRRQTKRVARVYRAILRAMQGGESVAPALAAWVPGNEAVMLVGADSAGPAVLQMAFKEMSTLLDRQQQARKKLRAALVANGIALTAIMGVVFMVVKLLVPQLEASEIRGMKSRMVFAPKYFAFGHGLIGYGPFIALSLVALAVLIGWSLPNWTRTKIGFSRRWFDQHLMPWTLYARTQSTFFLSTTAAMMRSGIPLKAIATDMLPFASPWMRTHLRKLLRDLEAGRPEVEALGAGMLPEDTSNRLFVYALMKDFTGIMTRLSNDNFVAFEDSINAISASLKLLSILILALFAAATLFAIFDYSNALQSAVNAMRSAAGG
ncbi:Type II secretion system F domain protein, partial [mine drainage metagenome]